MRARVHAFTLVVLRGAAVFFAAFTVIGLAGEIRGRTLDVSLWWIDLRDLPTIPRLVLLGAFAGLVATWAIRLAPGRRRRWVTAALAWVVAGLAIRDVVRFASVVTAGEIRPFVAVPLSLVIAGVLGLLGLGIVRLRRDDSAGWKREAIGVAVAAGAWAAVFPLAQMLFFGTTDYRRPADLAVVFGARVYATGQPSALLADRIRTGVELYEGGLVPVLIMSGGDGSDGFNEARVMRDVAVTAGVQPAAVLVDPAGSSTEATVANVAALLATRSAGPPRVIAVSQAYHLPRVQLAFANAGIDVLTVPAGDPEPIGEMPILIARETLAFWAYYLRICLG